MPNKNTFDIPPIANLISEEMTSGGGMQRGLWIDPFANKNRFADITNDLNPKFDTDYHLDALDFLKMFEDNSVDGVLFDPPYSTRQIKECYESVGIKCGMENTQSSFWGNLKIEVGRILKVGGKAISFGWNSGGIGMSNGMEIDRILLVPHGGIHNDTICVVEHKVNDSKSGESLW